MKAPWSTDFEVVPVFEGKELTAPFAGATEQEAMDLAREGIDKMIRHQEAMIRRRTEHGFPAELTAEWIVELNKLQNCVYRVREVTYGEWR